MVEIPVESLVCPLAVIDVRDADYRLAPDDIAAFEAQHAEIPQVACVTIQSGWADHVSTDRLCESDADCALNFLGFHVGGVYGSVQKPTLSGKRSFELLPAKPDSEPSVADVALCTDDGIHILLVGAA